MSSLSGSGPSRHLFWRCGGLLPGFSPVFDRTETLLGKIFSTFASLPELSLEALPPREFSLGSGTIKASSWRCGGLLQGVSPVLDRTETILGKIFSTFASLPELSLEARPPREFSLGFGTIKAFSSRCSGLLPGTSPVFDRTKTILGEIFSTFASLPELSLEARPPVSSLSGSVPSRHILRAVVIYYRGSLQHSIVQKLFWGKSFPPSPAFQSCLWKRVPPVSSLPGSVPSRHLLGAVAVYYRGLSSIRSYRDYSWGNRFHLRQPSRAVSGSAPPP